jgi:hypothetical protein
MGAETHDTGSVACLARAISAELRKRYPHHTAKHVSQDLDCTPKAAANLLGGHLSAASVAKVIMAYGPGWVAERVLEAAGTNLSTYIETQAAEAERAAARALDRAGEARRLHATLETARRQHSGDLGPRP